jgi:hypothetical protein
MKNFNYASPLELLSLLQANTYHDDRHYGQKLGYGVGISGDKNIQNDEQQE